MNTFKEILGTLYPYLPGALLLMIMFGLALLAVVFVLLRLAKKRAEKGAEEAPEAAAEEAGGEAEAAGERRAVRGRGFSLAGSFAMALRILRENIPGRNFRYQAPWFIMCGQAKAGVSSALRNCGLGQALSEPGSEFGASSPLNWWFFDNGVVLDLSGDIILTEDGRPGNGRFDRFLRLLQKHRHQKPADGIILAVPATELYGPDDEYDDRIKEAGSRASLLFDKLRHAQKVLGLRLPVYLLVTKCDKVEGFADFVQAMPPRLRDSMVGWSNPYSVDAGFSEEWCDEIFSDLSKQVHEVQMELYADADNLPRPDKVFAFPLRFQTMFEPLRQYIQGIFQQSAYHESFLFRGVYFSGDAEPKRGGPALRSRPVFLRHLLNRKVFPEHGLCRPIAGVLAQRNRRVTGLQIATVALVVLWGLGMLFAHSSLKSDIRSLTPLLENIAQEVSQDRRSTPGDLTSGYNFLQLLSEPASLTDFEERALTLFEGMINARSSRLWSFFLPGSWVSPLQGQMQQAMIVAYDHIILRAMFIGLIQKTKEVIQTQTIPEFIQPTTQDFYFVEETPEFKDLRSFLESLERLKRMVDAYNNLKQTADLNAIYEIVNYVFGVQLPESFFRDSTFYQEALREVEYRSLKFRVFRIKTRAKFRKLLELLHQRLIDHNPVPAAVRVLDKRLNAFEDKPEEVRRDRDAIARLLQAVLYTEKVLGQPEYAWLNNPTLDLGPEFQGVLEQARSTEMIGTEYVAERMDPWEKDYQRLKAELELMRSDLTGPILARQDDNVVMRLSEGVLALKNSMQDFEAQRFMEYEQRRTLMSAPPDGHRFQWNVDLLDQALRLAEPYKEFLQQKLAEFPSELQDPVKKTGRDRLQRNMMDLIARAQNVGAQSQGVFADSLEKDARMEIRNFKEAMPYFLMLLETFDRLEMVDASIALAEVVDNQAYVLLDLVDYLLAEDGLYEPKGGGFQWWNGKSVLAYAAYDASGQEELQHYLDLQRKRVKKLALDYAEPLVTYFLSRPVYQQDYIYMLTAKWERIIKALDQYESKQPDNALVELERLILFDLNEITLANFSEKISQEILEARSGNYFLQRRIDLMKSVHLRCLALVKDGFLQDYSRLARFFNENLAGRYPFGGEPTDMRGLEADPAEVRSLFALFDQYVRSGEAVLRSREHDIVSAEKVLGFIDQLKEVREFCRPFLKEEYGPPEYLFKVEFRVLPRAESGAENVIEWVLAVGDQTMRFMGEKDQGVWRLGDPVRFSLRWAKDSPIVPVDEPTAPHMRLEGRTVFFDYRNAWSLIAFLEENLAPTADLLHNGKQPPHVLKFTVHTAAEGSGETVEGTDQIVWSGTDTARLFIRVKVLMPVKSDEEEDKPAEMVELKVPAFPERAPELRPADGPALQP